MNQTDFFKDKDGFIRSKKSIRPQEKYDDESLNVSVVERIKNIDNNMINLKLNIDTGEETPTTVTVSRISFFNLNAEVVNAGVPLIEKRFWLPVASALESSAPTTYQHSSLGFGEYQGKLIFKADTAIGTESSYIGTFDVGNKGSLDGWLEVVSREVKGSIALETMVTLGLSAVTMGFLNERVDGSLMVHIFSDSSRGKTTSSALAISTAGNPFSSTKGTSLQSDYGSTENYRIGMLSNNFGFPVVIDEASRITQRDISNFIYAVCNGESRGRLNPDGTPKEVFHWKTCCISNGEGSLLPLCNKNLGIRARLIEIQFDTLTESAEQSERIKHGIAQHYGWANKELAQYIIDNRKNVIEFFEESAKELKTQLESLGSISTRLSRKLAVIVTTAKIANRALPLCFDEKRIQDLLVESVTNQAEEDEPNIGQKLIDFILEDLLAHQERYGKCFEREICFEKSGDSDTVKTLEIPNNCFAIKKETRENIEILFFPNKFERFLEIAGFTNKDVCLKAIKEAGYLVVDKDGHKTVKRKISGIYVRVYVFRFPLEFVSPRDVSEITGDFSGLDSFEFDETEESTDALLLEDDNLLENL